MRTVDPGFLRLEEHAADSDTTPDAIGRLRAGDLHAVVLHRVIDPALLPGLVQRLETNAPGFEVTEFPGPFRSFFYGRNLNLNEPELAEYYAQAARFRQALAALGAPDGLDLAARVAQVLAQFDEGRPYRAAPAPGGQAHFFTTLRGHRTGGYIPPHFDNEQAMRPSYRNIAPQITGDIYSFVLTLAEANAGGQLELFDLRAEDHRDARNDDHARARPDVTGVARVALPIPAGSMVLVNSGRLLHQVTPVEGPQSRWTMCSFMALARDGQSVLAWG